MELTYEEFLSLETFFKLFGLEINSDFEIIKPLNEQGLKLTIENKEITFQVSTGNLNLIGQARFDLTFEGTSKLLVNYQLGDYYHGTYKCDNGRVENTFSYVRGKDALTLDFSSLSFSIEIMKDDVFRSYKYLENPYLGNLLFCYFQKQKNSEFLYDDFVNILKKDAENLEGVVFRNGEKTTYTRSFNVYRERLEKGEFMQQLAPHIFEEIKAIRGFLEKDGVALMDNLIRISLDSFQDDELVSLLGIEISDRNKQKTL